MLEHLEIINQVYSLFKSGKTDELKILLFEHPEIYLDECNYALQFACQQVDLDFCYFLLSLGSSPNLDEKNISSPLIEAVKVRDKDIISLMLYSGGDPNLATKLNDTPYTIAKGLEDVDDEIFHYLELSEEEISQRVRGSYQDEEAINRVKGRINKDEHKETVSGEIEIDTSKTVVKGSKLKSDDIVRFLHQKDEFDRELAILKKEKLIAKKRNLQSLIHNSDQVANRIKKAIKDNQITGNSFLDDVDIGLGHVEHDPFDEDRTLKTEKSKNLSEYIYSQDTEIDSQENDHNPFEENNDINLKSKNKKKKNFLQADEKEDKGRTPFLLAVQNGNIEEVNSFLEDGVNLEVKDYDGMTALMIAIECNHIEIFNLLLPKYKNLNTKNKIGANPLIISVMNNRLEMMNILLARGAKRDSKIKGQTILMLASTLGYLDIVKELVYKHKFNIFTDKDFKGRTAVDYAKTTRQIAILQFFVDYSNQKKEAS
ncbi:MAG: ankyrin repeat domain-containing protein [Halobacteriovoraceae bacterium]|nr:ankyrin repeat domain-containing protein [Halobacteriovoraceae bacterium]